MTLGFPDDYPNGLPSGRFRGRVDLGILLLIAIVAAGLLFALTR
jgi:hypothetical protein